MRMKSTRSAFGTRGAVQTEPLGRGPRTGETERTAASPEREQLAFEDDAVTLEEGIALRLGGRIGPCRIAYRLVGARAAPVVAVMGGITADRRVCAVPGRDETPGWWEGVVGPGRGLDLYRWRVLTVDFLAGPGGSSAPLPDGTGIVPSLTPADQASALRAVADHLELHTFHAVMGASYGGAVAMAFAADHADRIRSALVIGSAHKSHPLATAVRVIQRRIVADAVARGKEREGLALARALAMTTYRSQEEFQLRFDGEPSSGLAGLRFPVEDYLDYNGQIFADRVDARSFLSLSLSMDLHRVDPGQVGVPVTLISMEPDSIAPAYLMRELREQLGPGHELIHVPSTCGHDGFLTDIEVFGRIVERFLDQPSGTP